MSAMTPREAADRLDYAHFASTLTAWKAEIETLQIHARATPAAVEGGDLRSAASDIEKVHGEYVCAPYGEPTIGGPEAVDLLDRALNRIHAHRCAPATPEVVTRAEAARVRAAVEAMGILPAEAPELRAWARSTVNDQDATARKAARLFILLLDAVAPAPPPRVLAVGDEAGKDAEIDSLPIGSTVMQSYGIPAHRSETGWLLPGDTEPRLTVALPATVIAIGGTP